MVEYPSNIDTASATRADGQRDLEFDAATIVRSTVSAF